MADRWLLHAPAGAQSLLLLLLLLVAAASASSDTSECRLLDCPNYRIIRYYQELGCVRNDGSSECCPTRYDCSSVLSVDKSKCYYDGKTYGHGDLVPTKDVCSSPCSCDVTDWGEARLRCAIPSCFVLRAPEGKESVCYPTFSLDRCCGTGLKCANDTKSPRNVIECVYKGKTYLEGQFIREADSECMKCVCQEGYDGTLNGPWCRRDSCDQFWLYAVHYFQRCAPVFSQGTKCCPSSIVCPSAEDTVVRRSEPSTANGGYQCSFGNHTLNVGDEVLDDRKRSTRCRCEVPPFVTCTA